MMKLLMQKGTWLISILSFIGVAACYPYLPAQVPIHWNYRWEVDNVADKNNIFILALIPLVMTVVFELLPKLDPKKDNYEKHSKAYNKLKYAIVILMIVLDWITVLTAIKTNIRMNIVMPIILGILFILIGNYLPKIKSNFFVGIRNPWTITDDYVWRKTHKAGGYLFAVIGLLMMVMGFMNNDLIDMAVMCLLVIGIVGINIYSYMLYRKQRTKRELN